MGWAGERPEIPWKDLPATLAIDTTVPEVTWLSPGERQARAALDHFLEQRLPFYGERRNDPTLDGQSDLSPYLHFGHLAAARVALEVEEPPRPRRFPGGLSGGTHRAPGVGG